MKTYFYNLAGGINQSASKTALGLDTKNLFWSDAKNIEILQNAGVVRQKGNVLLLSLTSSEEIIGIHPLKEDKTYNLLIATKLGKLYVYGAKSQSLTLLSKTIDGGARPSFVGFLDGVIISSKNDALFYLNNDEGYLTESCNLNYSTGTPIKTDVVCSYGGRVFVGSGSTLYYSALGKYNDFTASNDAGYINNFFTDTNDITALKPYKDYLAIYKESSVYLLSGTSNEDFKITPFADRGTKSFSGVVNVNNKQYFINQGVFSMEQAGLLSQIQLGEEISKIIKPEFEKFDKTRFDEVIVLNYEAKNQVWYFIPYKNDRYFHTIWIYDYINNAWYKRVLPQDITSACLSDDYIITTDVDGNIYKEDFGNTFSGNPIQFMWKSPFLSAGDANVRKTIEEFFFILDENYDNNFNFSVFKNYDNEYRDDEDKIFSINSDNLIWYGDNITDLMNFNWSSDNASEHSDWAISSDAFCKAEISESNYSVQLCVEGKTAEQNAAIIGLEFKEIYVEE